MASSSVVLPRSQMPLAQRATAEYIRHSWRNRNGMPPIYVKLAELPPLVETLIHAEAVPPSAHPQTGAGVKEVGLAAFVVGHGAFQCCPERRRVLGVRHVREFVDEYVVDQRRR